MSKNRLTVALVEANLKKDREYVAYCKTSDQKDNPSVIEMRLKAEGRVDAFEAILWAMRGDRSLITVQAVLS